MATREEPLLQYLKDVNGEDNANSDLSGGNGVHFFIECGSNEILRIDRMYIELKCAGKLSSDAYGSATILVNGINILLIKNNKTINLNGNVPIVDNPGWAKDTIRLQDLEFNKGQEKALSAIWEFPEGGLIINKGEKLSVLLNDDFSVLIRHRFKIDGMRFLLN